MEEWRFLEQFGVEVSRAGQVRRRGVVLRQRLFNGYRVINLGKNKRVFVHRLIAFAFCVKPEGCEVVDHVDANKLNIAPENLEWVTPSENARRYNAMKWGECVGPPHDESIQGPALEALLAGLADVFGGLPSFTNISDEELAA